MRKKVIRPDGQYTATNHIQSRKMRANLMCFQTPTQRSFSVFAVFGVKRPGGIHNT